MSAGSAALAVYQRARRAHWVARTQLHARAARATLTLDIHPTARIHPGVTVVVAHGTSNTLTIGPRCRIEAGVVIDLHGGTVTMGADVEVRRTTILHVIGELNFAGGNILSWGCTVHCGERIDLDELASCSEYVTITDSRHFHTSEERFFYHNSESQPVHIGRNSWLAAKATVLPGADVGDLAVVGCNSVVGGRVPRAMLVAGAPAR